MSSGTIRVGVVGAGLIGRKRVAALGPSMPLVAVCDVDRSRAEQLAATVPDAVTVATVDELCGRDDIDVVVVATTHDHLASIAERAVVRGKTVFVEKPGATSRAELAAVQQAAHEAGVIVRVGYNHRFHPSVRRAKSFIDTGGYGRLLWIRGRYGHGGRVGYENEWRADPSVSGGGELLDQGSHLIDLVRFFAGDVQLGFAELPSLYWPMPVEDNAFVALRLLNGGVAWLHASWSEWKNTFSFEVTLERAKLEITGLGGSYGTERLTLFEMSPEMGPPMTTSWEWPFPDRSWEAEMLDLAATLRGDETVGATVADALAVLDVVDDAYTRFRPQPSIPRNERR